MESDASSQVLRPSVPYVAPLNLYAGRSVLIRGTVRNADYKRFNIDFCCGQLLQGEHLDDKALHINPRFDSHGVWPFSSADRHIVLNSLTSNEWGLEHRCPNTLAIGESFTLRILALRDYYKLTLNDKLLADFVHRIPMDRIKFIYIDGCVKLELVEYQGSISSPKPNAPPPDSNDIPPVIVYKPEIPYQQTIAGFLPPHYLKITGTPRRSASRFSFNIVIRSETLFHFRVDMPTKQIPQGFVIRNSTENTEWLKEEREIPSFPFVVGHTFDLAFIAKERHVEINVDGNPFAIFRYRANLRPEFVDGFNINGDLIVQSVEYL